MVALVLQPIEVAARLHRRLSRAAEESGSCHPSCTAGFLPHVLVTMAWASSVALARCDHGISGHHRT